MSENCGGARRSPDLTSLSPVFPVLREFTGKIPPIWRVEGLCPPPNLRPEGVQTWGSSRWKFISTRVSSQRKSTVTHLNFIPAQNRYKSSLSAQRRAV